MKIHDNKERKRRVRTLEQQIQKLQARLAHTEKTEIKDGILRVKVAKEQRRFRRVHIREGKDEGIGEFFLILHVTAQRDTVFIPLSIASGRKPTGFVYQIEGTGDADIRTTDISVSGDKITQVTLGTLEYIQIPKGATAAIRIRIEIRGFMHESYSISIYRIHYKHAPSDARYKKFEGEIRTRILRFS